MAVYLALRDVELDSDGRPSLPASWVVTPVETTPAPTWTAYAPGSRDAIIVTRCASSGGRALYAIEGPKAWLDGLDHDEVAPAREVYRLALAGPGKARTIMRAWRWWRCDVTEMVEGEAVHFDGVARELLADGETLPSGALPWVIGDRTVRALVRPVLAPGGVPWTMAGLGMHTAIENEADRGD